MKTTLRSLSLSAFAIFSSFTVAQAAENYVIRANATIVKAPAGTTVKHVAGSGVYDITVTLNFQYLVQCAAVATPYFVDPNTPYADQIILGVPVSLANGKFTLSVFTYLNGKASDGGFSLLTGRC
jgi:hypothetical protein